MLLDFDHHLDPNPFPPPWASAWGEDDHGLFAELEIGDARQTMRWVEPGEFLMGSPESEQDRHSDEGPQHVVQISQGFWLADTACNQRFYSRVVGQLPEQRFPVDDNPVTNVSWNDIKKDFMPRLNLSLGGFGVQACLPSEAQWEYACRASTSGPFSTGQTITTEQANFNGNYPYLRGEKKGRFIEKTLPVIAFEPNPWGFYQMHGNVWEWVNDAPRKYTDDKAIDPGDPMLGHVDPASRSRGVRGGSWISYAQSLRSARRFEGGPADRDGGIGFRLALRFASPGGARSGAHGELSIENGMAAEPLAKPERRHEQ